MTFAHVHLSLRVRYLCPQFLLARMIGVQQDHRLVRSPRVFHGTAKLGQTSDEPDAFAIVDFHEIPSGGTVESVRVVVEALKMFPL